MKRMYPVIVCEGSHNVGISFVDLPINVIAPTLREALAECQGVFDAFMVDEAILPEPSSLRQAQAAHPPDDSVGGAGVVQLVGIDTGLYHTR